MSATKPYVMIKGTKNGLVFQMDDRCAWPVLLDELNQKLKQYDGRLLGGPMVRVSVQLGNRYLENRDKQELKQFIRENGNLIVDEFKCNVVLQSELEQARLESDVKIIHKTIRSGQLIKCKENILILGDVNPGSSIVSDGHIFIMGALRGMAHAGHAGERDAIIAASVLHPTQLRIADAVSRPPDEWAEAEYHRQFAYVEDEQIFVDKLNNLYQVRPNMKNVLQA